MSSDRYCSVVEAARLKDVSRTTIYTWLAKGWLKSETIAGRFVIVRASLKHVEKGAK